jgi:hypothetical protein
MQHGVLKKFIARAVNKTLLYATQMNPCTTKQVLEKKWAMQF